MTTLPKGANCKSSQELPRRHKLDGSPTLFVRYALTAKCTITQMQNVVKNALIIQFRHFAEMHVMALVTKRFNYFTQTKIISYGLGSLAESKIG